MAENIEQKIEAALDDTPKDVLKLSTGYTVRVLPMPDTLVQKLYAQFPKLEPPTVHIVQKGREWDEQNPDDPNYIEAERERNMQFGDALLRMVLLRCVQIVEAPDGAPSYEEDTEWLEELTYLGLPIPASHASRRAEWIRYRVVVTNEDALAIQRVSAEVNGVTEEEVKKVEERFQRNS